ncbi:YggT family protein [Olsenella uli]|uniref:YggT family protein n=1 Tax=Olsenella uli TaxID=133926 RepID=UPI0012AB7BF4|nr:YggT family protein [Olsenella uli]
MLIYQIGQVIRALFNFYEMLIVVWCILSWFPVREGSLVGDVAVVVNRLVAPYMNLFRRFVPPLGGIDFSPIVAIFALSIIENVVLPLLGALGALL